MEENTRRMLGYEEGEETAGEGLPTPKIDMVGAIIACNQFLIDYYNKHGMLPSQNPEIWGKGIVAELIPLQVKANK